MFMHISCSEARVRLVQTEEALMNDRVNTTSFQILNTLQVLKVAEFAQK